MNELKTITLFPAVNFSDVMMRFHQSEGSRILSARAPKVPRGREQYWVITHTGPRPDMTGLAEGN